MAPILNFKTLRPATPCEYINGYIAVPEFSYVGPIWKGASECVTQFNYSAERSFVLKTRPVKPSNPNFCPVIKFRVGYTVYRYKLWQEVGEVIHIPLYVGQVIKKNFVIEIWNVDAYNEVSSDGFNIELGLRKVPDSNYSSLADFDVDSDPGVITPAMMISNSVALSTTGLVARYTAEGWAGGNLEDQVGNFDLTKVGTPTAGGTYVNPNASGGQFYPIVCDAGSYFSGASPIAGLATTHYLVMLMAQHTWSANEIILGTFPNGIGATQIAQRTSSPNVAARMSTPTYGNVFSPGALDEYAVLVLEANPITLSYAGLGNNRNSQVTMSGFVHPADLQIGEANIYFSDLIILSSSGDVDNAVNYLLNARGFADVVPTEPSGDIAWLDNE